MSLNDRTPASGTAQSAGSYPISRTFGITVLLALVALVALRHLFGSIRLEGGVR